MAAVTAAAAWWSPAVPWWVAMAGLALAFVARRPAVLVVAVGLLAACLGARAWQGARPATAGPFRAAATLVSDPRDLGGAIECEVRARGHHYEVWAHGRPGWVLEGREAGQTVTLVGTLSPRRPGDDAAARRHVVGSIAVTGAEPRDDGDVLARVTNGLRGVVLAGERSLPSARQGLYGGFVLGDDRDESPALIDDFRGAGLTHLLVVSGENVAFVLVAAGPVLRRLGPRGRLLATMLLLAVFASMTRFEPSVLRATAMAAIAISAWSLGRPASGVRVLALAVTAVVLIDPMLVGLVGFQLSVAAAAGIIVLAPSLQHHLPMPVWLSRPLSVTLAAQAAVSPILIAHAGGVPVASIPANLLAEPAAAVLMAWGLTVGVLAGMVGGGLGTVLQAPAGWLTWWVATVARSGGRSPVRPTRSVGPRARHGGRVGGRAGGSQAAPLQAGVAWVLAVAVLAAPGLSLVWSRPATEQHLGTSGVLWTGADASGSHAVLVLDATAHPVELLDGLRRAGVSRLDLVVSPRSGATSADVVAILRQRVRVVRVWAPHRTGRAGPRPGPSPTRRRSAMP